MHRISQLFIKKISTRLSAEEEAALQAWANESEENRRLYDHLTDHSSLKATMDLWRMVDSRRAAADMQHRIDRILWRQRLWRYGAVAAVAVVILGLTTLFYTSTETGVDDVRVAVQTAMPLTAEDIKPGVTYALLSDAAGHNVVLNAADTAKVATVLLTVSGDSLDVTDLCLDVPRGGEFKVQLEDGTEVWLNSASKLYYPKTFSGDMRKVRVEGEAYLSVATDSLRPFYVETDNQLVRVYGTAFNIRYYPEENEVYTTLEKGKVSLKRADSVGGEFFLTPGHQAVFAISDSKVRVREVNTDVVTSWRKGRFVFEHQTLLRIMQDLSRWYDFNYEFTDESLKNEEFMGSIPRYSDFTTAIAILEKCGGIRFAVDDGRVLISRTDELSPVASK